MPITLKTKTVFHCTCIHCHYAWDSEKKPQRCANCKIRSWNGEDHRFLDPYDGVPVDSQIAIGTEAPQLPSHQPLLDSMVKARDVIDQLITQNPCEHRKGACVCNEKEVLASLERQIEKVKALRPLRSTYLVRKNGKAEAK